MDRVRLKNVIILILALANLFLLGALATRRSEERAAQDRITAELTELLTSEGIRLSAQVPTRLPPASRSMDRDLSSERQVALSLLGEGMTETDEGGGIYTCSSPLGTAQFRTGGRFEITGRLSRADPEAVCEKFCQAFGYGDLTADIAGGSGSAAAVQYFDGYPVVNAQVEFLVEDSCLISVSGIHLPTASPASEAGRGSMTAATALTKFLEARRTGGAVVSEVTDLYFCYETQTSAASSVFLTAAWCIVTDTGNYYVNCSTGTVTRK